MKMLCFFVQGFTEKVGIPYYTACMRNSCSVLGIFEESSVSYSLNSKMCGCIELMVWKELLHFSWLLILRILVLLLVPKVHQMPCRLKLLLCVWFMLCFPLSYSWLISVCHSMICWKHHTLCSYWFFKHAHSSHIPRQFILILLLWTSTRNIAGPFSHPPLPSVGCVLLLCSSIAPCTLPL